MAIPDAIVDSINRCHGTRFRLMRAAAGGESGAACILVDDSGVEYILKWGAGGEFRRRQAVAITQRLRNRGYPAPEFIAIGEHNEAQYLVQKMLSGSTSTEITPALLQRIVELNHLQSDVAADLEDGWPARIVQSLEHGFKDWCVHDSLAAHSEETAPMLEELQLTARLVGTGSFRTRDAVHFDFSSANILVENGAISGVIDWNGCCAGDRAFDLVTLGYYALENESIAAWLLERAREISGPKAVALYLSHMVLRQLDWSIRHHDEATIERYLNMSRTAVKVIQDLRDLLGGATR